MEATFCLGRQPLTTSPLLFTSNLSNLPVVNRNVGIRHSSLSLIRGYMRSSYHLIRPVACTLDRFPKPRNNNGNNDNKPKSMVGAAAVLACVLGIISCSSSKYTAMALGPPIPSATQDQAKDITIQGPPSLPGDGRHALNSLLEVFHNTMSREAQNDIGVSMQCQVKLGPNRTSMELFRNVPSEVGTKQDFASLKRQAFSMLKCGMVNEAMEMVKQKYEVAEKGDPEMAYLLDMLLVEILICQGKYKEALSRECLNDSLLPDSRRSLYKAILYTMSNNEADSIEAMKCWDDFVSSLDGGFQPGT